jgi:hypothetical protein
MLTFVVPAIVVVVAALVFVLVLLSVVLGAVQQGAAAGGGGLCQGGIVRYTWREGGKEGGSSSSNITQGVSIELVGSARRGMAPHMLDGCSKYNIGPTGAAQSGVRQAQGSYTCCPVFLTTRRVAAVVRPVGNLGNPAVT